MHLNENMQKYAFIPKYAKICNYESMPDYCKFVDSDIYSIHILLKLSVTNMHLHEIPCPSNFFFQEENQQFI